MGTLNLKKVKEGTRPGDESTPFTAYKLKVTLTAPGTVSFNNYNIVWPNGSTAVETPSGTSMVYEVPVSSTDASGVSITGIPYGTSYTVEEDDSASTQYVSSTTFKLNGTDQAGSSATSTLGDSNAVQVTNSYSGTHKQMQL